MNIILSAFFKTYTAKLAGENEVNMKHKKKREN
jgi:hypothetical protein